MATSVDAENEIFPSHFIQSISCGTNLMPFRLVLRFIRILGQWPVDGCMYAVCAMRLAVYSVYTVHAAYFTRTSFLNCRNGTSCDERCKRPLAKIPIQKVNDSVDYSCINLDQLFTVPHTYIDKLTTLNWLLRSQTATWFKKFTGFVPSFITCFRYFPLQIPKISRNNQRNSRRKQQLYKINLDCQYEQCMTTVFCCSISMLPPSRSIFNFIWEK